MGAANGWLVFGVSRELLEGEGGKSSCNKSKFLERSFAVLGVFVLLVWLAIRCAAVEFAWSRDLHEFLFLATCTSVQALSPCSTVPEHPFGEGFVCRGAAVSKGKGLGEGRLQ